MKEKHESSEKNIQNIKNAVKVMRWFCDKIPGKKNKKPTEILAWKYLIQ